MARRFVMEMPCYYLDFSDVVPPKNVYLRAPTAALTTVAPSEVQENLDYIGGDGTNVFTSYQTGTAGTGRDVIKNGLVAYGATPPAPVTLLVAGHDLGAIAVALPLDTDDVLVIGAKGFARITAGVVAWKVTHTSYTGRMPVAIAVRGTQAMFVYRTPSTATTTGSLWYTISDISRSNGTTNPFTWSAYTFTIGGSVGAYDIGESAGPALLGIEIVPHVWSDFDYASCAYADMTGDGLQVFSILSFDGPAAASGGRWICSGVGRVVDAELEYTIGTVSVETGASGGALNYSQYTLSALITRTAILAQSPLPPGYDSYNIQSVHGGFEFYTPAPNVPSAFWTDFVQSTEIV
jgi:hypothetical protein